MVYLSNEDLGPKPINALLNITTNTAYPGDQVVGTITNQGAGFNGRVILMYQVDMSWPYLNDSSYSASVPKGSDSESDVSDDDISTSVANNLTITTHSNGGRHSKRRDLNYHRDGRKRRCPCLKAPAVTTTSSASVPKCSKCGSQVRWILSKEALINTQEVVQCSHLDLFINTGCTNFQLNVPSNARNYSLSEAPIEFQSKMKNANASLAYCVQIASPSFKSNPFRVELMCPPVPAPEPFFDNTKKTHTFIKGSIVLHTMVERAVIGPNDSVPSRFDIINSTSSDATVSSWRNIKPSYSCSMAGFTDNFKADSDISAFISHLQFKNCPISLSFPEINISTKMVTVLGSTSTFTTNKSKSFNLTVVPQPFTVSSTINLELPPDYYKPDPDNGATEVTEEMFENERKIPLKGFSKKNLLFTERGQYSNEDGGPYMMDDTLPKGWRWNSPTWTLDEDYGDDGWKYSTLWGTGWTRKQRIYSIVRRKRFFRVRSRPHAPNAAHDLVVSTEVIVNSAAPSHAPPNYEQPQPPVVPQQMQNPLYPQIPSAPALEDGPPPPYVA